MAGRSGISGKAEGAVGRVGGEWGVRLVFVFKVGETVVGSLASGCSLVEENQVARERGDHSWGGRGASGEPVQGLSRCSSWGGGA